MVETIIVYKTSIYKESNLLLHTYFFLRTLLFVTIPLNASRRFFRTYKKDVLERTSLMKH